MGLFWTFWNFETFFICFPIGWCIHLHCHFGPFWHLSPYWLGMKVLCRNAWYHTFFGDKILFCLITFQCGVVLCLSIVARDGYPLRTGVVGPFLFLCRVLSDVSCTHVLWFLHGKDVPLFMWYVCWMLLWLLQNLSEMDYGLNDGLWWSDIRFVDNLRFCKTYILSSVHLGVLPFRFPWDSLRNSWLRHLASIRHSKGSKGN